MTDWENALSVAFTGFTSVFLVLGVLSITVYFTGVLVKKVENRQKNQMELQNRRY